MSLAHAHTVTALLVRALGDAGVSADVEVRFSTTGVVIEPAPQADDLAWRIALVTVEDLLDGHRVADVRGRTVNVSGAIDGVPVTATTPARMEVVDPAPRIRAEIRAGVDRDHDEAAS
jgi:hypothetical protein